MLVITSFPIDLNGATCDQYLYLGRGVYFKKENEYIHYAPVAYVNPGIFTIVTREDLRLLPDCETPDQFRVGCTTTPTFERACLPAYVQRMQQERDDGRLLSFEEAEMVSSYERTEKLNPGGRGWRTAQWGRDMESAKYFANLAVWGEEAC